MSQENVEVVRRATDVFNRGDFEAIPGNLDPEIEDITRADFVDADTLRGHESVLRYLRSLVTDSQGWFGEPEDLIDVGEQVVVSIPSAGRGKPSAGPGEMTWTAVWSLRDGKRCRRGCDSHAAGNHALRADRSLSRRSI
jgi:ketosteroid isomerase-like protein